MWIKVKETEHWAEIRLHAVHTACGREYPLGLTAAAIKPRKPCKVCLRWVAAVREAGNLEEE